jgi:hypothetical protein
MESGPDVVIELGIPETRAVIDTSVLADGRLRRELQQQAKLGRFVALWSPWIVGELHRVLTWRWLKRRRDFGDANWRECGRKARIMMELLIPVFETVDPRPPYPDAWPELADPWDLPVWAAAKHGGANFVVSQNTRDFPSVDPLGRRRSEGVEYVTAGAFLELLNGAIDS